MTRTSLCPIPSSDVFEASLSLDRGGVVVNAVPFLWRVVVGRPPDRSAPSEQYVWIDDPIVSRRHCVVRQSLGGRFFIRDESVNGTRVDGRRLSPNVEVEIHAGVDIEVAGRYSLVLSVGDVITEDLHGSVTQGDTHGIEPTEIEVTILVGDIAGYTSLNQRFSAADVAASVKRVFAELESVVTDFHGSIKEYQGDAIFAFWELDQLASEQHTVQASYCALALQQKVAELAADRSVWSLGREFPLVMEWALATGDVVITTIGDERPVGLAILGDIVNYAFRLEKLAGEEYGRILASKATEARARDIFEFQSVGEHSVQGRAGSEQVFALKAVKHLEPPPPRTAT